MIAHCTCGTSLIYDTIFLRTPNICQSRICDGNNFSGGMHCFLHLNGRVASFNGSVRMHDNRIKALHRPANDSG